MMETPTRESPKKMTFLNRFGGFWTTDRKLNASSEGKKENPPPPKKKSWLVSYTSLITSRHVNHTTLDRRNCKRAFQSKDGDWVCKQCHQLRKKDLRDRQDAHYLQPRLPLTASAELSAVRKMELFILVRRWEQKSCRYCR